VITVYLKSIDEGTDNECWVICAKNDPGAIAFVGNPRLPEIPRQKRRSLASTSHQENTP
jgi:hypothetical protein